MHSTSPGKEYQVKSFLARVGDSGLCGEGVDRRMRLFGSKPQAIDSIGVTSKVIGGLRLAVEESDESPCFRPSRACGGGHV